MLLEDILLDENGNFVVAANGDMETVSGDNCLLQDVRHRLLTFPGDLWTDTEYGAGIQRYIQAEDTEMNRLELQQRIKTRIAMDTRIDQESIKVTISSWERDKISIVLTFFPAVYAFDDEGDVPEDQADIVLTISQNGITFSGGTA